MEISIIVSTDDDEEKSRNKEVKKAPQKNQKSEISFGRRRTLLAV
jgi:hypothetical protein